MPSPQAIQNRQDIQDIRRRMLSGELSYAEAAEQAAPIIKRINESAKAVAKKHGMRPQMVSFAAIMR